MEDELDDAGAVAQVDEDQPAVVAAAVDPAGDPHLGIDPVAQHFAAPGVAVAVRAQGRRLAHASPPVISSTRLPVSTGALLAAVHVAQLGAAVGLEDQHPPGADPGRLFELPLEAAPGQIDLGREPGVAQLDRQRHRPPALPRVGDRDEGVAPGRLVLLVERQQDPLDPGRPADRRRRRPAELLDQAVVAAAAADLRLRPERVADEGEDRPRVVVEAADQGRVDDVVDARRLEQRLDLARSARRPRPPARRRSSARSPSRPGPPRRRSRRRAAG